MSELRSQARELVLAVAAAFQRLARQRGCCHDDIIAREEAHDAERLITLIYEDPKFKSDFDRLAWLYSAGIVWGAKCRALSREPGEDLLALLAAEDPAQFSRPLERRLFALDDAARSAFLEELYLEWQRLYAPYAAQPEGAQLASSLGYVALHLGVSMLFDLAKVPVGTRFDLLALDARLVGDTAATGRMAVWARRLLDLSARNRLLNARPSKDVLYLQGLAPAELENALAAGEELEIGEQARLTAELTPAALRRQLRVLCRLGRSDLEETGSNTLFAAVGFLRWRERGDAGTYLAPILLVPVHLRLRAETGVLARRDEETVINTTLLEYLRSERNLEVPGLEPLPGDDNGVDVEAVLARFREAINGSEDFEVTPAVAVGHFSFGKFAMWRDLTANHHLLELNPLVRHIVHALGKYEDGIAAPAPESALAAGQSGELYCPLSADSSQMAAVAYSALGKSFVLSGPPGTGKSQTIANMIAHNLALGRSVLFVSEKKAALDVVHRRLKAVGLEPFTLELHSNKCDHASVMAQFAAALNLSGATDCEEWAALMRQRTQCAAELEAYARTLHHRYPSRLSAWDCYERALQEGPGNYADCLRFDVRETTAEQLRTKTEALRQLAHEFRETPREALLALPRFGDFAWTPDNREALRTAAERLLAIGRRLAGDEFRMNMLFEVAEARKAFDAATNSWWLRRCWRRRRLCREAAGWWHHHRQPTLAEVEAMMEAGEEYVSAAAELGEFFALKILGDSLEPNDRVAQAVLDHLDAIGAVIRYQRRREVAEREDLPRFIDLLEHGEVAPGQLATVFEQAFAAALRSRVENDSETLSAFSSSVHARLTSDFSQLITRGEQLARQVAYAKIAARRPDFTGARMDPELNRQLGALKREMNRRRGHIGMRRLLADVGPLARRLKPCFLMSPLSVAQYLEADCEPFDLVIFDEASQIEVSDAIGVIARGRQVVVTGDAQQMPPTRFFTAEGSAEAREGEIEDAESILVEGLNVGFPQLDLTWHYRSAHEALIAFSNRWFYHGRLLTFPSASTSPRLGMAFHRVENAVYGRGVNPIEAQAVVDYVISEVTSEEWRQHPRSIGVVTFNIRQQELIEELIDERCDREPQLRSVLLGDESSDGEGERMFFVRNLENVQGDEADEIVFSVTYGSDENGKVAMNFGPLNRDGGERRLNVAVTRSREQMTVFTSMVPSQIVAGETAAAGVRALRAFLEYAQSGAGAVSAHGELSGFPALVAERLRVQGYEVQGAVGASAARVDMVVSEPDRPGEILAGILFDGPGYAALPTARDRDLQLPSVLTRSGWRLCRVWIADWSHDPQAAEARLLEELAAIKAQKARVA